MTYDCQGTLNAYARRLVLDGSKGFRVSGFPGSENTELAILNASGAPEFLVHPAVTECGCFPDDHVFVTHFGPKGPTHYDRAPGTFRFELSDGSGYLDCKITLSGGKPEPDSFPVE